MSTMPTQKPGRSKQDWCTPPEFLAAVRHLLGIDEFALDAAATADNAVCPAYLDEATDALSTGWATRGWVWCNPPYGDIAEWVLKARLEAEAGTKVAMLLPLSAGSNWWRDHVDGHASVYIINGRLTFVGATAPYPKDCALLLYTKPKVSTYKVWDWRNELNEAT